MELLVRIVDKVSNDPDKNKQLTKAGDVIAFKPDGSSWGLMELKNPEWRIIRVDITEAEAEALIAPELPPDLDNEYILLKRQMKIDLDALDVLSSGAVLDGKRVDSVITAENALLNKQIGIFSTDEEVQACISKISLYEIEKISKIEPLDIEKAEIKIQIAKTELELKKQSLLKDNPELVALNETLKQAVMANCIHCTVDQQHVRTCMVLKT